MYPMSSFLDKGRIDTNPNPPMMKLIWTNMFVSIGSGYTFMLCFGKKVEDIFPVGYHIGSLFVTGAVGPWMILFAFEKFFAMAMLLAANTIGLFYAFVCVVRKRAEYKPGQYPKLLWLYDRAVVDGMAICTAWYVHSIVFFGNLSIAYIDGPDKTAKLRGNCNPAEDCGLPLVGLFVIFVLGWFLCDLILIPHYTRHVKSMYPVICYICIAVLRAYHAHPGGRELVELIYIGLMISSLLTWMFRDRLQEKRRMAKKME